MGNGKGTNPNDPNGKGTNPIDPNGKGGINPFPFFNLKLGGPGGKKNDGNDGSKKNNIEDIVINANMYMDNNMGKNQSKEISEYTRKIALENKKKISQLILESGIKIGVTCTPGENCPCDKDINCPCIKGKNCPEDAKGATKVQLKDIKCIPGKNCPCKKGVNCPCTKGKNCPTESNLKQKGDDYLRKLVIPKGLDPTGRIKKVIEDIHGKKTTCTEGIDCPCKPGVDCPCIDGTDCPIIKTPLAMDKCKPGVV